MVGGVKGCRLGSGMLTGITLALPLGQEPGAEALAAMLAPLRR